MCVCAIECVRFVCYMYIMKFNVVNEGSQAWPPAAAAAQQG